ncbi:transporter substrate-binding domain-containing protein [Paraburkholderia sediminicola]|uniref:Transporter substrate-binding domain-containing protein n=1 Tax=Paraburkholderia metrosideri TaxID=580937 RepID=A0ABW9E0F4_9BURK
MTDLHPRVDEAVVRRFSPTGTLRAAINVGNPILANRDAITGELYGVSIDLATRFAQMLRVDIDLRVFESAGEAVAAVTANEADIGFFAIDPLRGAGISFTSPYVLIEGFYLVRKDSSISENADVDQPHNRVAVGRGSAYDLFLSRELKHARIVRAPTSPAVVQTFVEQNLEVAAGVRQQLEADARVTPGLRILNARFMVIQQAMGTPKGRGEAAAATLHAFVDAMKSSGFVANALARHGVVGASVAPAS